MEIADDWIPHHKRAMSVREFLAKKFILVLPQAHYSPYLSPYDLYLFPKLKSGVKSYHFQTLDSGQKVVTDAIKTITETDFQSCYEAWKIRGPSVLLQRDVIFKGTMLI
jgi:hypothetical protein